MSNARNLARLLPDSSGKVPTTQIGAGSVIQFVQTVKSDSFSTTSGTAVDITGMAATITPKFATSKILVTISLYSSTDSSPYPKIFLQRNGTNIALGDALNSATRTSMGASFIAGNQPISTSSQLTYSDSPATTSPVTYKLQCYVFSSRVWLVNRDVFNGADLNTVTTPSTITLMEIAA